MGSGRSLNTMASRSSIRLPTIPFNSQATQKDLKGSLGGDFGGSGVVHNAMVSPAVTTGGAPSLAISDPSLPSPVPLTETKVSQETPTRGLALERITLLAQGCSLVEL